MADWISATALMFRSSLSARRRFLRTGKNSGSPRRTLASTLRLAVLDRRPRRPIGRRSSSRGQSPRRRDRFECPGPPTGRRCAPAGVATWPGSTNRTRVVPSGAAKSRRKHSPSRSLRRTISCCRLCHWLARTKSSSTACTSASRAAPAALARLGQHAVAVAAADDVADAVLVAVDGEGVAGGQGAALAADLGQLRLVEDHAGRPGREPRSPPRQNQRVPSPS